MQKQDVTVLLAGNSYPGRGIVLGRSPEGSHAVLAYFIMGRSENSRNRVFVEKEGGILTQAFDPAKLADPSLILYAPVRTLPGGWTVVTNGDQTDTIAAYLERGGTFEAALRTRTFEPDGPHFTPRISGLLKAGDGTMSYQLSILKSADDTGESVQRFFFDYPQPLAGEGRFLHTYQGDGNPLPSFQGEPRRVDIPGGNVDAFTGALWESLNPENKISLFVRWVSLADGQAETRIVNQNH